MNRTFYGINKVLVIKPLLPLLTRSMPIAWTNIWRAWMDGCLNDCLLITMNKFQSNIINCVQSWVQILILNFFQELISDINLAPDWSWKFDYWLLNIPRREQIWKEKIFGLHGIIKRIFSFYSFVSRHSFCFYGHR